MKRVPNSNKINSLFRYYKKQVFGTLFDNKKTYSLILTSPRSRYISPKIAESSDDLPEPDDPTTMINFPSKI